MANIRKGFIITENQQLAEKSLTSLRFEIKRLLGSNINLPTKMCYLLHLPGNNSGNPVSVFRFCNLLFKYLL